MTFTPAQQKRIDELDREYAARDALKKQKTGKRKVAIYKAPPPMEAFESTDPDLDTTAEDLVAQIAEIDSAIETQDAHMAETMDIVASLQERRQAVSERLREIEMFVTRRSQLADELEELKAHPPITKQDEEKMAASAVVISKMVDQYLTTTVAKNYVELKKAAGVPDDFRLELEACGEEGAAQYLRPNPTKSKPAARAEFWKSDRGKVIYNLMQHPLVSMGGSRATVLKRLEDQAPVDFTQFGESILRTV